MVVLQVHVVSIAVMKAERYAPITADGDAPGALALALQFVKTESRHIQFGNALRGIKIVKNDPRAFYQRGAMARDSPESNNCFRPLCRNVFIIQRHSVTYNVTVTI